METVTIKASIRKLSGIRQAYQAIHAIVRPVAKSEQGAVVAVPFALAGVARRTLNENSAALLSVFQPHEDAVDVLRKQYRDKVEEEQAAIKDEYPVGSEDREPLLKACEDRINRELSREVEDMLDEEREVVLKIINRASLNEDTNAFYPEAIGILLNQGLISSGDAKKKPKADGED